MNEQAEFEEPLNNVDLESSILGLKMVFNEEEEAEARKRFLDIVRDSPLAVPTAQPAPTNPDGSLIPGSDIQLIVVQDANEVSGVPAFTTLTGLRMSLPQLPNGMFLTGAQLGNILAGSNLKVFIDGPGLHAELETEELAFLAQSAQQIAERQQAAAERNEPLELALRSFSQNDAPETREQITQTFLEGFTRIPVVTQQDGDSPSLILTMGSGNPEDGGQTIPLLVEEGSLMCFTSEDTLSAWGESERQALTLPGGMVAQMTAQAGIMNIRINAGSESEATLEVAPDRIHVR